MKDNSTDLVDFLSRYQCLFIDAYGVLNDGSGKYQHALELLNFLIHRKKHICLLVTNDAATPLNELEKRWQGYFTQSQIASSGRTLNDYLNSDSTLKTVVMVGRESTKGVVINPTVHTLTVTEWTRQSQIKVDALLVMSSIGFDWDHTLNNSLELLRLNPTCKLIGPNPDLVYSIDDTKRGIAAGTLAKVISDCTGRSILWLGKPHKQIFETAMKLAEKEFSNSPEYLHAHLTKNQVLMIGDTLETDILGASHFGIDSLLIEGGISQYSPNASVRITPTARTGQFALNQKVYTL